MNPAAQNPHGGGGANAGGGGANAGGGGATRHEGQRPGAPPGAPSAGQPATARPGVQFGPVGRWWDDKSVVRTVGLTTDQQRRMDTIFNASKPAILASYQNYLKEQAKLSALSHNPQATQDSTFAAIDAVNQARAALQKATAQMYLQIRQQMKPEQIQKLETLE
jgi:Spy/CpxP family protein refolding chaperone